MLSNKVNYDIFKDYNVFKRFIVSLIHLLNGFIERINE